MLFVLLGLFSCVKDGEVGPNGEKGEQGVQGIPGLNGATILSDVSNPTSAIGKDGDFYINLSNQTLFGPKKNNDWGKGISLSGSMGEKGEAGLNGKNGKDGNTILHGKSEPLETLGKEGDFYFDTENLLLYGAKTTIGWGVPVSLKSNLNNVVRVLIKDDYKLKIQNEYLRIGNSENYLHYALDYIPIELKVGDISEYINKGVVIIQTKLKNELWQSEEAYKEYNSDLIYFRIESYINKNVNFVDDKIIFKTNFSTFRIKGVSEQLGLVKFQEELDKNPISFKIILIPASSIQLLSKQFPNNNINEQFIKKYYGLL